MEDFYNPNSRFDESNVIHETAIIYDNVQLGKNNVIGAYAVIGSNGEIRGVSQSEFKGKVVIGDNNVISELVTIQRPFENTSTVIGSNNIIMAHSHIGHDVTIGDNCEICTGSIIGGYAVIADNVKVKLGVTVRNRKKINKGALVGLGAVVVKDVEAETIVVGNPAKVLKK
jgi:acyl-[acyl carrier protein]--UDP-N-acetylglucosamine O-acyltransferase